MITVDINADLGERYSGQPDDVDRSLLAIVTSANIACGGHAGDVKVMRETIALAAANGVSIGAHPSYPDAARFGRAETGAAPQQIFDDVRRQVSAMIEACADERAELRYVKPHGALYNRAARDSNAAEAIVRAVSSLDPALAILGLHGSALLRAASEAGLGAYAEAFPDREYLPDGSLMPRSEPGSVVSDADDIRARALSMVRSHRIHTRAGTVLLIRADSLCIHGDGENAVEAARATRAGLEAAGCVVRSFIA